MKKIICWVVACLLSVAVHAEIQTQIEPSQISLDSAFKLILTQDNSQTGGVPDLTVLQDSFVIMGTERSLNYSIINGQAQSSSQWVVTLKAKKPGVIEIPAIQMGSDHTQPMTIKVEITSKPQETEASTETTQEVMLRTTIDKQDYFINQQVKYKVKLYNSKRLLDADYQGPQVENALIVPLGDAKRYQEVVNATNYVVEEQNYAIFPQKSGKLKIISPTFTALTYDFDPQRIKVQDKAIEIKVNPIPKQFDGSTWLPAKQVKLSDEYENTNQTISQGSTLTRTVMIEGEGVPAQLLPVISFQKTDGFNVYPEKGKEKNWVIQGELTGKSEIKVTYLFNKPGKIIIPEIKLPWFNTTTGKEETAVLPPRTLEIIPSNGVQPVAEKKQSVGNDMNNTTKPQKMNEPMEQSYSKWAWIMACFFAMGWGVTVGLWLWKKPLVLSGQTHYKSSLKVLNKACHDCNPVKARDALLIWARLHWPGVPILSLSDVSKITTDVSLRKQLTLLSQALYKTHQQALWRGDELWRCIQSIKKKGVGNKNKNNPLPPIHPF